MRKLKLLLVACATLVMCGAANAQTWTGNAPAEGTFFLYNVGAEKFINNGDPNQEWGTNAYLQAGFGLDIKLEANGEAYNLNTNVSNGGSSYYLATSTWCDGAATPWTFTAVEGQDNTYTISDGTSYLVANDALNDIVYGASTGDSKSWWKLVSLDDFKTAMQAKAYSATDPMDVSVFIQGRSFARNDGRNSSWTTTHNGGNWTWIGASANKYYGNEAWNNTFSVSQTIENLPDGTYEVKCSGFGTNGTTYIFANNTSQAIQTDNTTSYGTNKEAKWKAIHEDNAFAGQTTGKFTLSGGTLNLGLKRETNKSGDWCVYDEFRLYYYGLDLSEFAATLAAAVAEAEAVEGTVPTAAYTTLAAVVTENNKTYTTAAEYTAAANAIVEATNTAKALQTSYARYTSVKTAALAIASSLDTSAADNEANAATTNEGINAAVATLRAAFLDALPDVTVPETGLDVTAVMVDNASVSTNTDFWTIANLSSQGGSAGVCNYGECEFYNRNFKFYQTLALTPGTWEFGVTGFHRAGNHKTYFYAGEDKILIPGVASSVVNNMAQAKDYFDAGNGKVALKFLVETAQNIEIGIDNQDTETDKWTIFRNFTLKYYGEPDYSVYEAQWTEAVAAAEAALTTYAEFDGFVATEKSALQTAKADVPTAAGLKAGYVAKISALTDATTAYTDACLAFESAKKAIADANAVKENHNFASATATTTFADAIKAISDKYDAGTLTREEAAAAGTTLGVAVSGWQANANGAASAYMNDGFSLNAFTGALYVNTWSVEGASDGTNFLVPFYENYGADANSLATNTFAGNITGLENGLYKVSVWVRARVKNDVDLADATGITINVNDGEAVNAAAGTQVGESRFLIGTFEAEGLVKDGKLNFNVNVLDGNNISWLSFKNVKYTKVRDLTPEEMAVIPADLALDAEATVFKGKTITLSPTSTTEDASIDGYVSWTSDNTSVATVDANGVVTGVAYGTANITATSSLNTEATATCAITVTAPLITEAENLDFAEGPVIDNHICTYSADMTKAENNTTYCRTQPVTGWTVVSTDADGKAAGIMTYGSSTGMGNNSIYAPSANSEGKTTGNVFGMVGVWTGSVQYVQNVKLTAGAYTITVPIYRNGGSSALTKNLIGVILDDGTEHLAKTTTYANSWTTETIKFTVAEDTYGKLSLGLNAPNKGSNDSQRLWIDGMNITFEPFATSEEIAALNAAIETAEGKTLGFDEGEYAPYVNTNALKALAAAKELDTENPIAQSDVTDATAALSGAVWTANTEEVNAFFDGAFAGTYSHDGNVMPTGWHGVGTQDNANNVRLMWNYTDNQGLNATSSKQAAFLKFTGIYGNEAGYTLPLKAGLYQLEFIYGGWNEKGTRTIKIYNDDNEATVTPSNVTALDNKAHTTESSWSTYVGYVEIPVDGDYIFSFYRENTTAQNQFVFSDIVLKKAVAEDVTIEETADYTPAEKYANVTFNRTLVKGWNGMVLPFDMSVDDVKATFNASKVKDFKSVTVTDGSATLEFEDANDVKAGKPFMMKADEAGTSYTISGVLLPAAELQPVSKESGDVKYTFTGSYAASTDLSNVVFALIQGDKYFYHNTGKPSSAKAFRAWFVNESTDEAGSRISFNFGDDVITGINEVQTNGQDAEAVYNLQGQRVVNAKKGLFIQNGKKVVIK